MDYLSAHVGYTVGVFLFKAILQTKRAMNGEALSSETSTCDTELLLAVVQEACRQVLGTGWVQGAECGWLGTGDRCEGLGTRWAQVAGRWLGAGGWVQGGHRCWLWAGCRC